MKQFLFFLFSFLSSLTSFGQPIAVCHNGLSYENFDNNGSIEIHGYDLDASSHTLDGAKFRFRINRIYDLNNNEMPDSNELHSSPPSTKSIIIRNTDPTFIFVQLWVIDDKGNYDSCNSFIELSNQWCSHGGIIKGRVVDLNGENLEGHIVDLENWDLNYRQNNLDGYPTDSDGKFELIKPSYNDWNLTPQSKTDFTNGVDIEDLKAIRDHILRKNKIVSPFKLVAADVNNDRKISVIDLVILRKNLLNLANGFPNNSSWRYFIDETDRYAFSFPVSSWHFPYKYLISCGLSWFDKEYDFIAIKIGDVVQ